MGLINETNAQYYAGQQAFTNSVNTVYTWTGNTLLVTSPKLNFKVLKNGVELVITTDYTVVDNSITLLVAPVLTDIIVIQLLEQSIWDNYGSYAYVSLTDIVNNFMVAYVGMDKLIPRAKRSDVIFHAKRGLQEFSYDTLKSVNSQELTIPPSLSLAIPQDYVNYVQLSWVDSSGVKHIIYPTTLTSNPTQPLLQNINGTPEQDGDGQNLESQQALTDARWASNNNLNITGQLTDEIFDQANVYNWEWWKMAYGQRYGLEPEVSQKNGWFTINEREGKFSFSSGLANQLIILEYISDGLAYDSDTKVPKMAEDALYAHIMHAMVASRANFPEYIVQRYKRERSAKLRNAKIRLSNIKLEEFTQVMRGKSKWIKH
tara:strand:- start:488 stop:1609 length:1122 start_codon:yes stop_codon:yes gene_type:complete